MNKSNKYSVYTGGARRHTNSNTTTETEMPAKPAGKEALADLLNDLHKRGIAELHIIRNITTARVYLSE